MYVSHYENRYPFGMKLDDLISHTHHGGIIMNTKKPFQLIALDLDGTLFNSESKISAENKAAIQKAAEQGIVFVISTGRPYTGLPLEAMTELNIRYAITTNGAAVYKVPEKECLFENSMPYHLVADIIEELLQLEIHMDLFIHGDAYTPLPCRDTFLKINALPDSLKEYILSTRKMVLDMVAFLREKQEDVQKITMNFLNREDGTFVDRDNAIEILKHYPEIYYLSGGFGNLEFTKQGISKAKGLSLLCGHLNIPLEQTIACGDSENDLDILKAAGLGIAMANAPELIRNQADEVTLSNDEHGVAAVIEKWVLEKN